MKRIWLLRLVPGGRFGRWWSATGLFLFIGGLVLLAHQLKPLEEQGFSRSVGLFFCVIIAYITPIFHYISYRTEEAFDELVASLAMPTEQAQRHRLGISHKPIGWFVMTLSIGAGLWLLQSWLLAGGGTEMLKQISAGSGYTIIAIIPLLVWLCMTCAIFALINNARLFRRLSSQVNIDLLDTQALTPFGRMAVSSTLVVIGSQASFSIMWLEGATNPWTTIPGLVTTTAALIFLFIAPVWPIHKALKSAKHHEAARLQEQINSLRGAGEQVDYSALAPILAFRREVMNVREWPFDLNLMTRLGLYLVIVPLTWIGAALIENLVDLFIA